MSIQIVHHGGRDGVTGSCHRLVVDPRHAVLVDCGLFQGEEVSNGRPPGDDRLRIDFPIDDVAALVVTHVHIDHVGRIPYLLAAGFKGPILCSEASARLLPIVLADAFALNFSRDARLVERYLKIIESRLVALPYRQWHTIVDSASTRCRVRLQRAGHILGSAYVEFDVANRETDQRTRVLFSGDLGAPHAPLLPAPRPPWHADIVVLESTYGDRNHPDRRQRRAQLRQVLEHALADGGTVIVPAFSIGRTQELLYELEDILHRAAGEAGDSAAVWRNLKVYLDSPLASRFTDEYQRLARFWDAEAHARLRSGRSPLAFERLIAIDDHNVHLANVDRLARGGQPAIVIAASGMCAGGRVVDYLKAMLGDPRHDVLFVGYQAAGTPGRAIQQHGPRGGHVDLDGTRLRIRAGIHTLAGYSAHADRDDLTRFVLRMRHPPREVRLVHGDRPAREALARHLTDKSGGRIRVVV